MLSFLMLIFAAAAFYTDMRARIIPNRLNACGALAGLGIQAWLYGWMGLAHGLIGASTGFGLLFVLYLFKAVGAGDVKFFASLGCYAGIEGVVPILMSSILLCGPAACFVLAGRGLFRFRTVQLYIIRILAKDRTLLEPSAVVHRFPFMAVVLPAVAWWALGWWTWEVM